MEHLWAPWRMAYILGDETKDGGCIFCACPSDPQRHRERLVLAVTEHALVMLNKFPYNNGHLMVAPRRHVADPADLPDDEHRALGELLRRATRVVRSVLRPEGMNVGMNLGRAAGAGIDAHCHWHVVPRWNGDTNFMPVVGDVKVVAEYLTASYDRLLPSFGPET
ncbi:MAG TPA: HIT domain-containing protein [Haliangiales bacterium]|nr:HIT domain-containing protein [Haliangiales bacterium]